MFRKTYLLIIFPFFLIFTYYNISVQYGWAGEFCDSPVVASNNSGWLFVRWFLGVACLSVICAWALVQGSIYVYGVWPVRKKHLAHIVVYICCFLCAILRIFYYVPDPFSWNDQVSICFTFAIDYITVFLVGAAFLTLLYLWSRVVSDSQKGKIAGKLRPVFNGLSIFSAASIVVRFSFAL